MRWCIGAAAASIDATHRVVRLGGVTVDITDRKNAEERQTLLVREVDHRARNALAVVQSIVRLTRAESKEAYIAAVEERIIALSRAHVLLSESRWQGANLSRLLDEELAPYRRSETEKIVTNGPAAFLEPATAQILALTLHELATNAAKYGALSSTVGRVRLSWQVGPGHLELEWVETGGPSVQPPQSEGYGAKSSPRASSASWTVARRLTGTQKDCASPCRFPSVKRRNSRKAYLVYAGRPKKTKALRYEKSWREIGFCWSRTKRSPV